MKQNWMTTKYRTFLLLSIAIMVVAIVLSVIGQGMNFGIDFTGGSLLTYSVGEAYDTADVEQILAAAGYPDAVAVKAIPTEASLERQAELAAAKQAVEEPEATEEATEEVVEEAAEQIRPMLNLDKSGIAKDDMTDLEVRLTLVDQTEGMDAAIDGAVKGVQSDAALLNTHLLTTSYIKTNELSNDFLGGYVFEYEMNREDFDIEAIRTAVNDALLKAEIPVDTIEFEQYAFVEEVEEVEEAAEETEATEATEEEAAEEIEEVEEEPAPVGTRLRVMLTLNDQTKEVRAILEREMGYKYENFSFLSIDHVSAVAGRDLIGNAVKALLIAFACMLIYIALRFDPMSGVSALLALIHDVLIMCSFMVFFRAFFQVNSSFIAAVLTIVGYSINNTIIIFDRIRETAKKPGYTQKPRMEVVSVAVRSTLSRTINTTITTLITLVLLYVFGIDTIREFAFPLIVGMLAGVYSSVLLSGQTWAVLCEKFGRKGKKA